MRLNAENLTYSTDYGQQSASRSQKVFGHHA
jgi:hypothetical protein